ncbi:MAG TPA: c-type cytochrome [Gammaproteobacteria bacterium]|nr:c-type cytochrome [Gammaproteobacteria bacterium]
MRQARTETFFSKRLGRGLFLSFVVVSLLLPGSAALGAIKLPPGPNRDLVYGKCRTCHDLQYLKDSKGITRGQWKGILQVMKGYGLKVSDQERGKLLEYLATYLGPNPPKTSAKSSSAKTQTKVSGKEVFTSQCVSCHQADGKGQPGEFPPLAGNPDLFRTKEFPALVVLNGMTGKIQVKGDTFNGNMPSFDFLSDDKIAAVIHYVRTQWGNKSNRPAGMEKLSADDVSTVRKKKLSPHQVHAYRGNHP